MDGFQAGNKKNMNIFKLNIKCQYKTLSFLLLILVCYVGILVMELRNGINPEVLYFALTIIALLFILPSLIIYIQYLTYSYSVVITIDRFKRKIILEKNKGVREFELDDVLEVIKECSYPIAENRIKWMATDSFYFYRIVLKQNSEVIITSIMADSFTLYGIKEKIVKRTFPFIFSGNRKIINRV